MAGKRQAVDGMGLFSKIQFALRWDRALEHAAKGKPAEGHRVIQAIAEPFRSKAYVKCLEMVLLRDLGRYTDALQAFEFVAIRVSSAQSNESEKRYLHVYARLCAGECYRKIFGADSPLPAKYQVGGDELHELSVPGYLQRWFPIGDRRK